MTKNEYTVLLMFDHGDPSRMLFVLKDRTCNKGLFNGIGGKFEQGESWYQCAHRELKEETGTGSVGPLNYLGSEVLEDRTGKPGTENTQCVLHFASGEIDASEVSQQPGETECLAWIPVRTLRTHPEFFAPGLHERLDAAVAGRDYVLHAIEVLGTKGGGHNG